MKPKIYDKLDYYDSPRRNMHKKHTENEKIIKLEKRQRRSLLDKDPNTVKAGRNGKYIGRRLNFPTYKVRKGDLYTIINEHLGTFECVNTNPIEWKEIIF